MWLFILSTNFGDPCKVRPYIATGCAVMCIERQGNVSVVTRVGDSLPHLVHTTVPHGETVCAMQ